MRLRDGRPFKIFRIRDPLPSDPAVVSVIKDYLGRNPLHETVEQEVPVAEAQQQVDKVMAEEHGNSCSIADGMLQGHEQANKSLEATLKKKRV
jgi:hypothetical protein